MEYENSLDLLDTILDTYTVLKFCQQNKVEILRGSDYMYECYINGTGSYCTELDAYSAMVFGINAYLEEQIK